MSSRRRTTITATAVVVISMIACVILLRQIDRVRPREISDDNAERS